MNLRLAVLFLFCCTSSVWSQTVELRGQVLADKDLENIHVINKTSKRFTTTNSKGQFIISAKYQDTILFTSVQYKSTEFIIGYTEIQNRTLTVYLEELVNVLDEVIIGKILTGDLESDVSNSDAERPIDFYDLGLPGYTGKPLTQNERRLADADGGTFFTLTTINVYKILNRITGRTKRLKERVYLERKTVLTNAINARLKDDFFSIYPLEEKYRNEFWYFCSEDVAFEERCSGKSDLEIYTFLIEKYDEFIQNLKERKD